MSAWHTADFETAEVLAATRWVGHLQACVSCASTTLEARGRCKTCYQQHIKALKKEGTFTPELTAKSLPERLWGRAVAGHGGCLVWTGPVSREGYGKIMANGRYVSTHRVAYELLIGPIPGGAHLDHACHTRDTSCIGGKACKHRRCINPHHLEPVSPQENLLRSVHTQAGMNSRKTHCDAGHPFDEANTYTCPRGTRKCRECRQEASRKYRASRAIPGPRKPGAAPATSHVGDSDPNPDEALRRVQGKPVPARADVDVLIDRIDQWHQEQVDAAYAERDQQLDAWVSYELTLDGWLV